MKVTDNANCYGIYVSSILVVSAFMEYPLQHTICREEQKPTEYYSFFHSFIQHIFIVCLLHDRYQSNQ